MDLGIRGKKALITAASRGLGLAVAEALAKEGSNVCIAARSLDALNAQARRLADTYGVQALPVAADLSQVSRASDLANQVLQDFGPVDLLISNVGGPQPSSAEKTTEDAWRQGFESIFLSSTLLTQRLLPGMRQNGFGRIVFLTSISVVEPIDHLAVSTTMRSAITGFAKTLATEVAGAGITVNTLMPGVIHTQRIEELRRARAERSGTQFEDEMQKTASEIPAKRLGRPEEFAAVAAFLCSEQAGYLTGCNIAVDGGLRKSW